MNNSDKQEDTFTVTIDGRPFPYDTLKGGRSQFPPQSGNWYASIFATRLHESTSPTQDQDAVDLTFEEGLPAGEYEIIDKGPVKAGYSKVVRNTMLTYKAISGKVILTKPLGTRAVGTFKELTLEKGVTLSDGSFDVLCPKPEPIP